MDVKKADFSLTKLGCPKGKFKMPQACRNNNNATTKAVSRPVLGDIYNIHRDKFDGPIKQDPKSVQNKLTKRATSFTHIRSKVDSNLHPVNKTVLNNGARLRKYESAASLAKKESGVKKIIHEAKQTDKNDTNVDISSNTTKACFDIPKTKEEIALSSEFLFNMELIEAAENNKPNPIMLVEYRNDIYSYLRTLENQSPLCENFMKGMHVNHKMRAILVDWLIEVQLQCRLLLETLHLTISILDRFLLKTNDVAKSELQLVGIASMVLACKYEEIYQPDINDFVILSDNAFTKQDIRKMECTILKTLDFNLSPPLPVHFLRRYSTVGAAEPIHHAMAKYFIELMLLDYTTCYYKPSEISAAAICLSLTLISKTAVHPRNVWSPILHYFSTYKFSQIESIVYKLANIISKKPIGCNKSVHNKYSSAKLMKVSMRPELDSMLVKKLACKA